MEPTTNGPDTAGQMVTRILKVDPTTLPHIPSHNSSHPHHNAPADTTAPLLEAAHLLRTTNIPIAFPTETVYGLGADATRSDAVRGIYTAKQRPSDNPLIVHVCSLGQLRGILNPPLRENGEEHITDHVGEGETDIPEIYTPLIQRFWPGPLTILLRNPAHSLLAPEVTAGLPTFGARMPNSPIALALIRLADVPLAAPSANASTRPSPTTAEHVHHDLRGRISLILDGGPCTVGVESTVVDGLSSPPAILRPGGISIDQLRACAGWEDVEVRYKDGAEEAEGDTKPRAPGMKYRHYSPTAKVVLYEAGTEPPTEEDLRAAVAGEERKVVGIVRTKRWRTWCGMRVQERISPQANAQRGGLMNGVSKPANIHLTPENVFNKDHPSSPPPIQQGALTLTTSLSTPPSSTTTAPTTTAPTTTTPTTSTTTPNNTSITIYTLSLTSSTPSIARGLFSSLRALDDLGVSVIFVEGISSDEREEGEETDLAAAVMNRMRKAAGRIVRR
ncbi:MAG: hypothetical protein M1817_002140 [Caeruleum heppii]|nr:MAG: hypothetical protein M1817_002140 [Caeruleum heppii]